MPNLKFKSWTGYDNLDFNKLCQKVISIFLECSKAKVAKSIWMHILNIHASKRHTYSPKRRFSTLISNLIKDPKSIQVSQLSAAMMSWVGCLLKNSELFILFAENSQILLKISVVPILLTGFILVALESVIKQLTQLIVQLNSLLRQIIDSKIIHSWLQPGRVRGQIMSTPLLLAHPDLLTYLTALWYSLSMSNEITIEIRLFTVCIGKCIINFECLFSYIKM